MGTSKTEHSSVHHYATRSFIDALITEVRDGQCFVPFLGSGVSSASGIIMGMEFTNYLAYVTYLVIGGRQPAHTADDPTKRYRLFDQGWPPLPDQTEIDEATKWISASFDAICERTGWAANCDSDGFVKSLTRSTDHPEDPITASLSQPPIPLVIRSRHAAAHVEMLERLKRMFEWRCSQPGSNTPTEVEDYFIQDTLTQTERIQEKAIRALSDWKSTLTFLSRIHVDRHDRLVLGDEQAAIIDAFNQFITRGRNPNLCHQMIAHLSMPMRFHTILSTNFDDLTEAAFRDQGIPLASMAVTTTGGLPSHHAVAAQDTLVKLHGQFHETRADKSLDEEPNDSDKATFASYMQRGKGHPHRPQHGVTDDSPIDRLLVIGYSGSDHRCVQLIRHWLENASTPRPDDKLVYWICHNDADVAKVKRLFRSETLAQRIVITENSRPDYLLFELYQRLCYALPPGSNAYEFPHATPPYRASLLTSTHTGRAAASPQSPELSREQTEFEIKQCILSCVHRRKHNGKWKVTRAKPWQPFYRLKDTEGPTPSMDHSHAWLIDASTVVASGAALAYEELTRTPSRKVMWFELNDAMDGDAVFRDFVRTLSVRCGRFGSQHVSIHPRAVGSIADAVKESTTDKRALHRQAERIARYVTTTLRDYRVSPESVVLMLYGRDGYGLCAGIAPIPWTTDTFTQLHTIIEGLALARVTVLYFPLTQSRAKARKDLIDSVSKQFHSNDKRTALDQDKWQHDDFSERTLNPDPSHTSGHESRELNNAAKALSQVKAVSEKLFRPYMAATGQEATIGTHPLRQTVLRQEDHDFLKWLYALTLFRQSRHPSAMFSEAVYPAPFEDNESGIDNDFLRYERTRQWIFQLETLDVFHAKPGGALWAHRDIRTILNNVTGEFLAAPHLDHTLATLSSEIHYGIGDWYQKAFFSSGHLTPLIEAIHHFVRSSLTSPHSYVTRSPNPDCSMEAIASKVRARRFVVGITQAEKTILIGLDLLRYWQSSAEEVSWLGTSGQSTIEKAASRAIRDIQFTVLSVNDDIRKEAQPIIRACKHSLDAFLKTLSHVSNMVQSTGSSSLPTASCVSYSRESSERRVADTFVHTLKRDFLVRLACLHEWINLGAKQNLDNSLNELLATAVSPKYPLIHTFIRHKSSETKYERRKFELFEDVLIDGAHSIRDVLQVVAECAYLLLRRAKAKWHAKRNLPLADWVVVSRYCEIGLDGCKHLPADQYRDELTLKAMFHQIRSVALSNLGRFQEARRHLTESQSALARSTQKTRTDQAIASIRHAEVAVTEAFWIQKALSLCGSEWAIQMKKQDDKKLPGLNRPRSASKGRRAKMIFVFDDNISLDKCKQSNRVVAPPLLTSRFALAHRKNRPEDLVGFTKRHYAVLLDEATLQLSRAEHLLRGASHSAHWWFQLHLLRLRIYGLLSGLDSDAYRCLICRHGTLEDGIKDSFLSAFRIADEEPFRILRCVKYYRLAIKTSFTSRRSDMSGASFARAYSHITGPSPDVDSCPFIFESLLTGVEQVVRATAPASCDPLLIRNVCTGSSQSPHDRLSALIIALVNRLNTEVPIDQRDNLLVKGWRRELHALRKCCTTPTEAYFS